MYRKNSLRLKNYDYSRNGAYFITICTQNREHLFGEIKNGEMILNDAGNMIKRWYYELENKFINVKALDMVIMPNHIHFILIIISMKENISIPKMIQWFKIMTTNEYIRGVKSNIYPPFQKRIWQRNYYEHIIRNEKSFNNIQNYIINNPQKWENDILYN